jgi:hypothetical protein
VSGSSLDEQKDFRRINQTMKIDENIRASIANQEAVRPIASCASWAAYIELYRSPTCYRRSSSHCSFPMRGIVLVTVAVRHFGRVIGVTKVYPVGMLRYFIVLGSLSVAMGLALVLSEAP